MAEILIYTVRQTAGRQVHREKATRTQQEGSQQQGGRSQEKPTLLALYFGLLVSKTVRKYLSAI